jgi:soluble lytic murein transglycosylase-like protein
MRIDFGAQYKDVQRLLRASARPTNHADGTGFAGSLNSLLPENQTIITASIATPPAQPSFSSSMEEVKASFKFAEPDLSLPLVNSAPPPMPASPDPSPNAQSVKTPTLLDVKRVEITESKVQAGTSHISKSEIHERLASAGKKFGVEPNLAMAVVKAESAFNPMAVSTDGHASKGLFQLLDSTGRHLLSRAENTNRHYDPFDPDLNIELGTSYLRYLQDIFQTPTDLPNDHRTRAAADKDSLEKLAVAAFNAGEGRVASAQHRAERAGKDPSQYDDVAPFLPDSTRTYVSRVISGKKLF